MSGNVVKVPFELVEKLAAGEDLVVQGCKLYSDVEEGEVWGEDPYRCTFLYRRDIFGNIEAAKEVIIAAVKAGKGDNLHDSIYDIESYERSREIEVVFVQGQAA